MAIIKKPYAGSTDKPYKSSNVWSQVIDTVNSVQSGGIGIVDKKFHPAYRKNEFEKQNIDLYC